MTGLSDKWQGHDVSEYFLLEPDPTAVSETVIKCQHTCQMNLTKINCLHRDFSFCQCDVTLWRACNGLQQISFLAKAIKTELLLFYQPNPQPVLNTGHQHPRNALLLPQFVTIVSGFDLVLFGKRSGGEEMEKEKGATNYKLLITSWYFDFWASLSSVYQVLILPDRLSNMFVLWRILSVTILTIKMPFNIEIGYLVNAVDRFVLHLVVKIRNGLRCYPEDGYQELRGSENTIWRPNKPGRDMQMWDNYAYNRPEFDRGQSWPTPSPHSQNLKATMTPRR